jgi:predicted TIM-barrel fold metal-dependent hydrolase
MLDGMPLVDAHVHAPRLSTLKPAWREWAVEFGGRYDWRSAYSADGDPIPAAFDALFESEGVDRALLFCEYSPRATGIQPIEDNLPLVEHNPDRFRLVANVNPHLHHPVVSEVERQLGMGAVALKVHPVHGAFSPADRELYPAYQVCADRGVPVIVHTGSSTFPGARARFGDPALLVDVVEDFPGLQVIFAHGGRGWWYDVAAFLALAKPNVWLDVAGLPPKKLPIYYARHDFTRLATRMVFGTDWPGIPGVAHNARALAELDLPEDVLRDVLSGNAAKLFPGLAI